MPNDIKPVCADITRTMGQEGNVIVADLREGSGMGYISMKNECLFRLNDGVLLGYGPQPGTVAQPSTGTKPDPK